MASCTFCKAKEVTKKTPFLSLQTNGKYEATTTFCCRAQETNHRYVAKRYKPGEEPPMEEVEKL